MDSRGGSGLDLAGLRRLVLPAVWEQLQQTLTIDGQVGAVQADDLVRRGWLTRFQAEQIQQGREEELLVDSYIILDRLGSGGMGQVFKARHQLMDRVVALKVMKPDRQWRPKYRERFKREIQAAAKLSHPNIVLAFDAVEWGEQFVFIMEFIEGKDLAKLLRERGPLPVALACDLVRQVALGLQHAHERGIMHRDVKPSNILITEGQVAKLVDLGLAIFSETPEGQSPEGLTSVGAVMGTPDFLAPEQALAPHGCDPRSDVYSVGCTLYTLLAGQVPFPGGSFTEKLLRHQMESPTPLASVRPDVPAELAALVDKLMARTPLDRLQTAGDVASALQPFCRSDGIVPAAIVSPSRPIGSGPPPATASQSAATVVDERFSARPSAKRKKRTRVRWMIAVLAAFVLTGVGWLVVEMIRGNPPITPDGPRTLVGPGMVKPDPPNQVVGLLHSLHGHTRLISALAFAPSGDVLFSGGLDGVRLWNWRGEKEIRRLPEELSEVRALAVDGPSNRLLVGTQGAAGWFGLWDSTKGQRLFELTGPDRPIPIVRIAPAGDISLGASDQRIYLHELGDGRARPVIDVPGSYLRAAAFTTDGKSVVAAVRRLRPTAEGMDICWWNASTGKPEREVHLHSTFVVCAALAPDCSQVLTAHLDHTIRLWDAATGKEVKRLDGHSAEIQTLAFSPDGKRALSGAGHYQGGRGTDCTMRLWDLATGSELKSFGEHEKPVSAVAFSADGALAASGGADKVVRVFGLPR